MGLNQNDPVIRQRMGLKQEFLLEDLAAEAAPNDEQLTQFMPHLDLVSIDLLQQATSRYFANSRQLTNHRKSQRPLIIGFGPAPPNCSGSG